MKRKVYYYIGKSPVSINMKKNPLFIYAYKKALINTLLKNKIISDDEARELINSITPSIFETEYYNGNMQ